MKKHRNLSAIIVALVLLIIGMVLVFVDLLLVKSESNVFISVGSSVLASGLVLLFTAIFVDFRKDYLVWTEWKLQTIFRTRAEKNKDSDPLLESAKIKQLDGIVFGLRSFRSNRKNDVLRNLQNGMNFRLLVMNPKGKFVKQREIEESAAKGSISKSIMDLMKWADELNKQSNKGQITIKYYDSMTLDFYWRIDDQIYIGPYWFETESQQTITYKFVKGGRGFEVYSEYFEELWRKCKRPSEYTKKK